MEMQTPSQTVGPFFAIGMVTPGQNILATDRTSGERILISGTVFDGDEKPIPDAVVEIWQADSGGFFNHPVDPLHEKADRHFRGFGRCGTDESGVYWFKTVRPGARPRSEGTPQTPFINVRVFARGMLIHAVTRLYFPDESANATDPVLNSIDANRRSTLISKRREGEDLRTYEFDIHMQGDHETVFFDA
jgi:protocatechuate 3,4-dioxygenase, alpha subunit